MPRAPINLAVLVSGSGTTLQNLIDHIAQKKLDARIALVIASRPNLPAQQRATDAGLPSIVIERPEEIFAAIDRAGADLVCLAGYLRLLDVPAAYADRVMNIHPALLPSFGGKRMYGTRVHQAVLDRGCKVSGCTVHFVDSVYDAGPIILQRTCAVEDDDTVQTLAVRVFEQEKIAYPQAISLFAAGRLKITGRRVRIIDPLE